MNSKIFRFATPQPATGAHFSSTKQLAITFWVAEYLQEIGKKIRGFVALFSSTSMLSLPQKVRLCGWPKR